MCPEKNIYIYCTTKKGHHKQIFFLISKKTGFKQIETQKQINCYQRYTETKQLLLPRDKPSSVYPKLCQSITNAECLSELAHFTTTKVGTEGGFYKRKRAFKLK
jgi:hypothetical protein